MLFDSHCHLNDEKFDDDIEEIIKIVQKHNDFKCLVDGFDLNSTYKAMYFCEKYDWAYLAGGMAPSDLPQDEEKLWNDLEEFKKLVKTNQKKFVAIGEMGLDYHWNKENKEIQKKLFIEQINFANECDLPIIIHTRDAIEDTIKILKENKVNKLGVFHCCPHNRELVKEGLKLGFYISFAGTITFKNAKNAEEIINMVPNDKLLIETDSPYLAPEPHRGTRNIPTNVKYVAEKVAKTKGLDIEMVENFTYENAKRLFDIN